ncbi:ZAR1-like protein [Spea bombifrons]|uniref:ZAR1-like protein n=1 Tax=Spea bombifrons TaxID=233779 RepID=UPI00234A7B87|nr:ZAR1-like protein [Spea bombifrons]
MAGFMFAPYNAYQGYGGGFGQTAPGPNAQPPLRNKPAAWKTGKALEPTDYLDNFQRAQLKAILSQVNPSLTPRLRKANTKEVGVQVNPRVDTGVQCSLGPRTLRRPPPLPVPARPAEPVHFTRPVAVYSPVVDRRLFSISQAGRLPRRGPGAPSFPKPGQCLDYTPVKAPEKELVTDSKEKPQGPQTEQQESVCSPEEQSHGEQEKSGNQGEQKKSTFQVTGCVKSLLMSLQFLEQKYGYFHCKDCKTRWESAYVWCISGSNKVYFKQLCRKCQKGFNPYRVEAIQCQVCAKTRCSCPQKKRHIDLKRPHRQELCGRCRNKRVSCDNTYSFKYIV